MRNFLLNYLRYRESIQNMIYTDCNRFKGWDCIKSHFKIRILGI